MNGYAEKGCRLVVRRFVEWQLEGMYSMILFELI